MDSVESLTVTSDGAHEMLEIIAALDPSVGGDLPQTGMSSLSSSRTVTIPHRTYLKSSTSCGQDLVGAER